ncbi:hypothetical protein ACTG0T_02300 [Halococcus morrhuae DSM 1307]|uniref:hypothetical protein n=1 Tax=Halococcus morrhuae TaxID=2250 RepID=UPI000AE7EC39|nr:hypothetical protein [Halococcus morrhuae]
MSANARVTRDFTTWKEHELLRERVSSYFGGSDYADRKGILRAVSELTSRGDIAEGDRSYEYCIEYVTRGWFVNSTLNASKDLGETVKHPNSTNYRLCLFSCGLTENLMEWDFQSQEQMIIKYEEEFSERSMFQYLKSRVYSNGYSSEHKRKALTAGYKAAKQIPENPNVYAQFAYAVSQGYPHIDGEYIEIGGDTIGIDDLWEEAMQYVQLALKIDDGNIGYRLALSNLHEVVQNYDQAKKSLKQIREMSGGSHVDEGYNVPPHGNIDIRSKLWEISQKDIQSEIESDVDNINTSVSDLEQRVEETKQSIDNASERYRDQALQFIGFFAAVVAVILSSIEIATSFSSFAEAGGLLLILTGGIILAFSGLSFSLRYSRSGGYNRRLLLLPAVGILLIIVGFGVPLMDLYR